jgi:RNA polymerase sigma-70 factor (ECF subfamily)
MSPKPSNLDVWVTGQVNDEFIERVRRFLGPTRNLDLEIRWPDGSAASLAEHLVDSHTGPGTALSRVERCDMVRAALERLDSIDRKILALHYFEGLNFAQIGLVLDMPGNTANVRALRAIVKLRELIPRDFRPARASRP